MIIKNKSNLEWMQYNCGYGVRVDIKAGATFEVSDKVGKKLLVLLGAPNWLVEISKEEAKKEKVEKKEKVQKIDEKENRIAKRTLDLDKPKKKKTNKSKK